MIIRDGGSVLAVDKVEDRLVAARQRLGEAYTPLAIDITSPTAPATIAQAVDGPVDILVNNAGVMDGFLPLAELDDETWEHVMAVNITAAVRLTRELLPAMISAGHGAIVNVSNEAALRSTCAGLAYSISKAAVNAFTQHVAALYSYDGIRCNAVAPGRSTPPPPTSCRAWPLSDWTRS